jgi:nucleoid-associated protein YgaU
MFVGGIRVIHVYKANTKRTKPLTMVILSLALTFLAFLMFAYMGNINTPVKSAGFAYERITVQKGDTLWGLAAKVNADNDINSLVHKTIQYNKLSSTYIQPGQVIYIPVKL